MQHRVGPPVVIRWIATILLGLSFMSGPLFVTGASAVQGSSEDQGLVGETDYVSPQFGYDVTWSSPWAVRESETVSEAGVNDRLWLDAVELTAWMTIEGLFTDQSLEEAVHEQARSYLSLDGRAPAFTFTVDEETAGMTVFFASGTDGEPVVVYVEVQTLVEGEALRVVTVTSSADLTNDALGSAMDLVSIDGESPLRATRTAVEVPETDAAESAVPATATDATPPSDEQTTGTGRDPNAAARELDETQPTAEAETTAEPSDEGRDEIGVLGETYESPTYGYTLEWDGDVWGVNIQQSESGPDGDFLLLESRLSQLSFQGFEEFGGDPAECFPALEDFLLDVGPDFEVENVEPIEDESGDPIEGEEDNRIYGTYAFTMTDTASGQGIDIAAYLECQSLPDSESVLVIIFTSLLEDFPDEFPKADAVIETLAMPNGGTSRGTSDGTAEPAENADSAPNGEGVYESPTYGFTFTYDPERWDVDTEGSQDGTDLIVLTDGPSTLQFVATEDFDGNALTCVNETIGSIRGQEGITAVELDRGPDGRTITGGDETHFYAQYSVSVSGGTFASTGDVTVYLECHSLSDSAVLLIQHIVSADRYDAEQPLAEEILATLEFAS